MKRLSTSLALCLAILPAPAFATTVGVSFSRLDDTFRGALHRSIRKHAEEIGVSLELADAKGDRDSQLQAVKDFVAAKVDAIVIAPIDGDMGPAISKIAADGGVPLVYVNAMPANIDDLPKNQAFVASDEAESGTLQAREVCRRLGGRGNVVVMMGELTNYAARQRTEDVAAVLAGEDCKGINVVERQSANWSTRQGEKLMGEWLAAGVGFDGVIANNDEMALGAIRAMKAAGLPVGRITVAGIDATADAMAAMAAGDLDVTVFQDAKGQSTLSLDAAVKLASGGTVPTKNYVPFQLVTPETAARFAAKN